MHSTSGSVERIKLPAPLALLLRSDLGRTRQRCFEDRFQFGAAFDLAADVADDPAEPAAQQAQLAMMALELFGVGIASRHHCRPLGDAPIRLPQPHAVPADPPVEPFHGRVQQLGVGREGDGLGLHRGVHRDALEIARAQRSGVVRHA